jgi:dihydrofolate synthase/folylpolyglutamate synthase
MDFTWQVHDDGSWDYRAAGIELAELPPPALQGSIQYRNAAVALRAFTALLAPHLPEAAAVATALRSVRLPGRMQFVPGPIEWVFDVAHNEAAAVVLAAELRSRPPRGQTLAVFGMLEDKDARAVAAQLDPVVDRWILCTPEGARALGAEQLRQRMGRVRGAAETAGEVAEACARAARLARPGDRVLVCGSFHTVGPALRARRLY